MNENLIGLVGDLHGNGRWAVNVLDVLAEAGVRRVMQLGDMGFWPGTSGERYIDEVCSALARNKQTMLVTPGNHEDYSQIEDPEDPDGGVSRQILRYGSEWELAVLPRGYAWTEPYEGGERRLVSFGGAPSIDFEMRTIGTSWWPEEMIRESDLERLNRSTDAEIMLCHDSPSGGTDAVQKIIDIPWHESPWTTAGLRYAKEGRELMNQAFAVVKPAVFVHGHYHVADERYDEELGTRFVSLGADGEKTNVAIMDLETLKVGWLR